MEINPNQIIGELVAQDYRAASIFKKYHIDFCCNGNRTIAEACDKRNQDMAPLLDDLTTATRTQDSGQTDFASWPLDLLADYIEKKHHRYVVDKTAEIRPFLDKVCRVHGPQHPELYEIQEQFLASAQELAMHMRKEEMILFPFIRQIQEARNAGQPVPAPPFGSVQNPVAMMMEEHTVEGDRFRKIAALSDDYTPPYGACNTYRVTFALLKEFEADLHLHIHLENNILFPRAIEMEKA